MKKNKKSKIKFLKNSANSKKNIGKKSKNKKYSKIIGGANAENKHNLISSLFTNNKGNAYNKMDFLSRCINHTGSATRLGSTSKQLHQCLMDSNARIQECMLLHNVMLMDTDTWNNLLNERQRWRSFEYDKSENMYIPNWTIDKPVVDKPEILFYQMSNDGIYWFILDPIANIIYQYWAKKMLSRTQARDYINSLGYFYRECIIH